jgi:methylated-DNA-protein-cysteine methyltransferase-like protein
METAAEYVYEFVKTVPPGKVVTYGQVAGMVEGVRLTAIQVGQIMYSAPEGVPWQRVVGSGGTLPIAKRDAQLAMMQRRLLEREGVVFKENGSADMARFQWRPAGDHLGGLFSET